MTGALVGAVVTGALVGNLVLGADVMGALVGATVGMNVGPLVVGAVVSRRRRRPLPM